MKTADNLLADPCATDTRGPATSLTRPGARAGQTCASCGSERVTSLAMTLTDGTPVSFRSCHDCEHRVWADSVGNLEFADVLLRTKKR
ncbi:MAG TPA: hypothetical protein VHV76_06130 [Mycobacteriales bacterium]|jgi:hypothetical protein|nr:hypothetical protein [Mycobacteriales bacterium]